MIGHTDWLRRSIARLSGAREVYVLRWYRAEIQVASELCGKKAAPWALRLHFDDVEAARAIGEPYATVWLRRKLDAAGWPRGAGWP